MKLKIIITILLAIFLSEFSIANNYKAGDTLWVVSFSGLTLRNAPSTTASKIGKIESTESVIILNTFEFKENRDTIEGFAGNWVYISKDDLKGYVFDAFISTLPIFESFAITEDMGNNFDGVYELLPNLLIEYTQRAFKKTGCEVKYSNINRGESSHSIEVINLENNHRLVKHGYWEGYATELEFYQIRNSEIYYFLKHLLKIIPILKIDEEIFRNANESFNRRKCIFKDSPNDCSEKILRKSSNHISIFFLFYT